MSSDLRHVKLDESKGKATQTEVRHSDKFLRLYKCNYGVLLLLIPAH